MKKFGLLVMFISIFTTISFSQIAAWDFFGESSPTSSAADIFNANIDASNLMTRGSGAASSTASNSFRTTGFQNNGILTSNTDYFQITLSATSGYTLSLSTIDARFAGTATFAASPGVTCQFAYSLDGTNFILIGSPIITIGTPATLPQIDLTGISALQNISDGMTITIRYYASGQTTTGGWGFNSPSAGAYGLSIGGALNPAAALPTLIASPSTLSGFTYIVGNGPSIAQSYVLSGTDLDGSNVTITAPTNYEISLDNSSFTSALTLTSYDVSNTTIYVRLIAGLAVNTYNGEVVVNAGGGATTVNVTCSGEVTPVLPDVVITEINDHPTFAYEYVEIFNNELSAVDLTGWKLLQLNSNQTTTLVDNANNVFEGSLILAPGAYAIIFRGNSTDFANFKSVYNIAITINAYTNDKLSNSSGAPQMNGSETYRLEDNLGNLIDFFGDYNGGTTPVFSVTAGDLYERREYPNNGILSGHWYTLTASSLGGSPAEPNENPLPVEITSFSATTIGKDVKLNWNTSTEVNNYGFEVERSVVKGEWNKIGFVNGNGNSNSPKDYSFVDDKVVAGKYSYRLKQIDNDGQFEYSKVIEIDVNGTKKFELTQNYPNPFNPTTTIQFQLPQTGMVKLTLYNILGQEIKTLVNETKEAGTHTINFDANELNSGVYIYKIESGSYTQTRKMTLVK